MLRDRRPHFPLNFTLPLSGRETPYGIPTAMMASLHPNASTYIENAIAIASHINPYLASSSVVNNFGRITQPAGG